MLGLRFFLAVVKQAGCFFLIRVGSLVWKRLLGPD